MFTHKQNNSRGHDSFLPDDALQEPHRGGGDDLTFSGAWAINRPLALA